MASIVTGAAAAGGVFASVPYVGWVVGLAASIIDSTVIYPRLAGDPEEATQPQLASLPTTEQGPGAPRTFAIGARMRVPAHVMYQSSKLRESGVGGGTKGGTNVTLKRVFVNALIHLNDRPTDEMTQLIGNGQLILFKDRNLLRIETESLSADVSGSNVVFSMVDASDPDFTDTFKVGDLIRPNNFVRVSGPTLFNDTYFEVDALTPASGSSGSTMTVVPISGQSVTSLSYSGGTPFSPAKVTRIDDGVGGSNITVVPFGATVVRLISDAPSIQDAARIFSVGDQVVVQNLELVPSGGGATFTQAIPGQVYRKVTLSFGVTVDIDISAGLSAAGAVWTADPVLLTPGIFPGREILVTAAAGTSFTSGIFPASFDQDTYYNEGGEQQGQPTILLQDFGSGNTSNYRGMASQGLEDCYVSAFGDQLPTNLEAILSIDPVMSWPQAVEAILQRGGLTNTQIDVSEMPQRPFRGAYVRGVVPVVQQLQPLLVAGQLVAQDRDGVVHVSTIDRCDSVQIENGAVLSDLQATLDGQASSIDKVQMEDKPQADMPTSIGVRFQDPDNALSNAYVHFGLRNPEGADHTNEQQLNLLNMVLTQREARNLAATTMRRAYVNQRTYRMTLPAAYLHLLENDLLTWTDDEGNDHVARIIQRDIGSNFLVNVTAVREMTELDVLGSPVQTSSGYVPQSTTATATLLTVPIDAPGVNNTQITQPGVLLACADVSGTLQSATVWESKDGNTYNPQGTVSSSAAVAGLIGTLSSQDASESYGTTTVSLRSQTVEVLWLNEGTETIEACTQAQAEAGKNWVAIVKDGDPSDVEIAAFTTVTVNSSGTYTLGGWLRGLRGTTSAARDGTYLMVMLTQSTGGLFYQEFGGPTPSSLNYRVVPSGGDLSTTTTTSFASPTFRNVLPLPVRKMTKSYNATTQTTRLLVEDAGVPTHWERTVLPLGTQPPHTLDEPLEHYRINLYYNGAWDTVLDTIELEADPSTGSNTLRDRYFDWADARATAGGYTPGPSETYYIGVIQVGQYGAGPEAKFEL